MTDQGVKPTECAECHTELQLGVNVLGAQEGVVGPRGFVPLEDMLFFCNEECLKRYFGDADLLKVPRKIP